MAVRLLRWLRQEHDCYWRRQYDKFNEGYKAASARADALMKENAELRAKADP